MSNTKLNTKSTTRGETPSDVDKFILPNKKVILRPIVRNKNFMGVENHDGAFMYTGTFKQWCIFRNQYGSYIDPFSTVERLWFEREMGKSFNVNQKDGFWTTFTFKITKGTHDISRLERTLDLSKPLDYASYKLLLTAPDVANSWVERDDTPEYKWVIVEGDEEAQHIVSLGKRKAFCYRWLEENESKVNTIREILWLMDVPVSSDNTKDELYNNMIQVIEDKKRVEKLYENITDENINTKLLFVKLIKGRFIHLKANKYYDKHGTLIAVNKDKCYEWLANPENSLTVENWKDELKTIKF